MATAKTTTLTFRIEPTTCNASPMMARLMTNR